MGAMFRSEEMALAQLFIQPEAAYESLALLGEAGVIQFRDVSHSSYITYHTYKFYMYDILYCQIIIK